MKCKQFINIARGLKKVEKTCRLEFSSWMRINRWSCQKRGAAVLSVGVTLVITTNFLTRGKVRLRSELEKTRKEPVDQGSGYGVASGVADSACLVSDLVIEADLIYQEERT